MADAQEIDHDLYSRQYYVYGKEAMEKMAKASVLICGLGGVGVEIAKNVALAGVRELVLNDTENISSFDLSTQFYAGEKDIGQNRAVISAQRVKELNPYTNVSANTKDIFADLSLLRPFSVVCLCNQPLQKQVQVSDFCHRNNIQLVISEVRGLFTSLFVGVGENFDVYDKDGEELKEVIIGGITKGEKTTIKCLQDHIHGLDAGDWITFREVKGPSELNGNHYYPIESTPNPSEIVIKHDSSSSADYVQGTGIIQQVKEVVKVSHKKLSESLENPELLFCDFGKLDAPPQIHIAFRAVNAFFDDKQKWPRPWNADDASEVVKHAQKINADSLKVELDTKLVELLSHVWLGELAPLTTSLGGVAGQEILKCVSGKFTPLNQHLYLDFREIAPARGTEPSGSRYDAQNIAISAEMTEKLQNLRLFMVGAGAIGCELLKTLAMMGCCTGKGELTVTDDDHIERSNLNRQFLFRDAHIGKPKSLTAKGSALEMNPSMVIDAHKRRVDPKSADIYTDAFFESMDCVLNALDNLEARKYVDHRITIAQRPLIESGTMGTKGHVQVIVPFITETYSQQNDPISKDVPFCTIKSFPHEINHCVQWARALAFQNHFVEKPNLFRQFKNTQNLLSLLHSPKVRTLKPWILAKLLDRRPKTFQDCVDYARLKWEKYFNHEPNQLLLLFPADHTVDNGKLFWSNPKRQPHALNFSASDPLHRQFIVSFANLWAFVWQLPAVRDENTIMEMVKSSPVPKFVPKKKNVETDESVSAEKAEEAKQDKVSDEAIAKYVEKLEEFVKAGFPAELEAVDFEKDDDSNFHIDCINSIANLRARVYTIPEIDRYETKKIAGRIIPAIAATTAVVSGLAAAELIKIMNGAKLEQYKSCFFNLSLPQFTLSEPGEVKKEKIAKGLYGTIWDRWEVKEGDMSLQDFLNFVSDKWKIEIGAVFQGNSQIWNGLMPKHRARLPKMVSELTKKTDEMEYVDLLAIVEEEEEDEDMEEDEEESGGQQFDFFLNEIQPLFDKFLKEKKPKNKARQTMSPMAEMTAPFSII